MLLRRRAERFAVRVACLTVALILIGALEVGAQGEDLLDQVESLTDRGETLSARDILGRWEREHQDAATPENLARFWYLQARLTPEAARAEMLYLRVVIEGSSSVYADDALMRLAQYAYTAGEHSKSIDYLGRLRQDFPTSELNAEAMLWIARNSHAQGNAEGACTAAEQGLREVAPTDATLLRALGEARAECGGAQGRYTVQVAAFKDGSAAQQLARDLMGRGYDTWILNGTPGDPFYRVRVGRGLDETRAEEVLGRLTSEGYSPFLVTEARRPGGD